MIDPCSDTDAETARVHQQLLREASPAQRVALALSLSRSVIMLSREAIKRALGADASDEEVGIRFVHLHYGADLADGVRRELSTRAR